MVIMDNRLDPVLKEAIIAYFEGWELVELLEVPIETVVELLEEHILDELTIVQEELGWEEGENEED